MPANEREEAAGKPAADFTFHVITRAAQVDAHRGSLTVGFADLMTASLGAILTGQALRVRLEQQERLASKWSY
jgi:hypothetical protein